MRITKLSKVNERVDAKAMIHALDNDVEKLYQLTHGRIEFGSGVDGERGVNISGEWQVIADTGSANTEFSVTHTLGAVPVGYIVTKISNAGVIYDSGTAWSDTTIYLKSSGANSAVSLFLLK